MRDQLFKFAMFVLTVLVCLLILWGLSQMGEGCDDPPCNFGKVK